MIVPPQMVSRRGEPEYSSAPLTVEPVGAEADPTGTRELDGAGIDGHIEEIAPPAPAQILPAAFVTFQVARKS